MLLILMKVRVILADTTGIDLPILDELAQKGGTDTFLYLHLYFF